MKKTELPRASAENIATVAKLEQRFLELGFVEQRVVELGVLEQRLVELRFVERRRRIRKVGR